MEHEDLLELVRDSLQEAKQLSLKEDVLSRVSWTKQKFAPSSPTLKDKLRNFQQTLRGGSSIPTFNHVLPFSTSLKGKFVNRDAYFQNVMDKSRGGKWISTKGVVSHCWKPSRPPDDKLKSRPKLVRVTCVNATVLKLPKIPLRKKAIIALFHSRRFRCSRKIYCDMAVFVARHGERFDYVQPKVFLESDDGKDRPWDPRLTTTGRMQGRALGSRISGECKSHSIPPVTRVFSSPFIRAVETANEACDSLELDKVHVEDGVVESLCDAWLRSWAVPGADTAWGGPPHCRHPTPVARSDLHPDELKGPERWMLSPEDLHERVSNRVCKQYTSHHGIKNSSITWENPEPYQDSALRLYDTVNKLHAKYPDETILFISHGGPCSAVYKSMTGIDDVPTSGYTSLYLYTKKDESQKHWDCNIAGCNKHIQGLGA